VSTSLIGSCVRKSRYRSQQVALEVAARCTAERGTPLHVYSCGLCGGWHLTSRIPAALVPALPPPPTPEERLLAERRDLRAKLHSLRDAVRLGSPARALLLRAEIVEVEGELHRLAARLADARADADRAATRAVAK
jgi:hypothetical protein